MCIRSWGDHLAELQLIRTNVCDPTLVILLSLTSGKPVSSDTLLSSVFFCMVDLNLTRSCNLHILSAPLHPRPFWDLYLRLTCNCNIVPGGCRLHDGVAFESIMHSYAGMRRGANGYWKRHIYIYIYWNQRYSPILALVSTAELQAIGWCCCPCCKVFYFTYRCNKDKEANFAKIRRNYE